MNTKFNLKHKIQPKNSNDKNQINKKQKKTLSKIGSVGALFKKNQIKIPPTIKKEEPPITKRPDPNKNDNPINNSSKTKGSVGSATTASSNKLYISPRQKNQYVVTSPKSCSSDNIAAHLKRNLEEKKKKVELLKTPTKLPKNISSVQAKQEVKNTLAKVINVYHRDKKPMIGKIEPSKKNQEPSIKEQKITRASFKFIDVVGQGGYGKVWKVQHLKNRGIYAMKEMSKPLIVLKKSVDNVLNELKILSKLSSPFISNITCAFNDRENIYLGMDFMEGGDFRSYLADSDRLKENEIKFAIACIIKSLQYIHKNKIFHRDVKPENIVIDQLGYLRLTDFGIARSMKNKSTLDASGTPGYMAPEVLCKQSHSYCVDFYALGIICYELMLGKRPYSGGNRMQIRDAILAKQHCIKKKQVPSGWSSQIADFINKLIMRQPTSRLGSKNGVSQLINHPWFKGFPWKQLEQKKLPSPYKKQVKKEKVSEMDSYDEAVNQYKLLERYDEKEDIFTNYYFTPR